MEKDYNIKTIKEILSVVNKDNVENFKKDFCSWLDLQISLKEINKIGSPFIKIEQVGEYIFHWIDDGKTGANIKIVFDQREKE